MWRSSEPLRPDVVPLTTNDAAALGPSLRALRRALHQRPEMGLELPHTQAAVLEALSGLDLEITLGQTCTSVVAVLRGRGGGRDHPPAVLLRADMDALPLTEQSGEPFAAPPGTMHACGHDLHTSALVGAATLLSRQRDTLTGDVVFMFQPGEEGWDGAATMINEGVLDAAGPRVSAAYGLHVFASHLPTGVFGTRPGPLMAASAAAVITVRGMGGHASRPHAAADPIVVAAELVIALQTLVTRQFDVFDPVLITVGSFHAGSRSNIIPNEARLEATLRTFSEANMARLQERVRRLSTDLAGAYGLAAEVDFSGDYPVTINDPDRAAFAVEVASDLFGAERAVTLPDPIMGSEDFSRVLAEVPGAFVFLGACTEADPLTAASNHSERARFDDGVLPDAALLLAELARRELARLSS